MQPRSLRGPAMKPETKKLLRAMSSTERETRSVFERYAIVSQSDISEAIGKLELRDGHSLGHSQQSEAKPTEQTTRQ
jgi:hypothetical protein